MWAVKGHPLAVGVSGRSWTHFNATWCGLDAGTTTVCARVDPGGRRPETRACCENCHLATPKSIFQTHQRSPPDIFPRPPSHELQNEPPWAFISARYQNLYVFARTHQAYQFLEGPWDLVPTAEGHPVGVSGRCRTHFDANWCGVDAGSTTVCARVDPGRRRPKARGCCENCHLATPKYIFRTHRR